MGRVVVQQFVSADGFGADESGDEAVVFADEGDGWPDFDRANAAWLDQAGLIVLDGTTYRRFVTYWPTPASTGEAVAVRINAMPKAVFSRSLTAAPWGDHPPARLLRGDAGPARRAAAAEVAGDATVWGSFDLTDQLFADGAVDVVRLVVVPVLLGRGRRALPADAVRHLRLQNARTFDDDAGLVELEYALAP